MYYVEIKFGVMPMEEWVFYVEEIEIIAKNKEKYIIKRRNKLEEKDHYVLHFVKKNNCDRDLKSGRIKISCVMKEIEKETLKKIAIEEVERMKEEYEKTINIRVKD